MSRPLTIVVRCPDQQMPRVRYAIDTLFLALSVPVSYSAQPPPEGPWLLYAERAEIAGDRERCIYVPYRTKAWQTFSKAESDVSFNVVADIPSILPSSESQAQETHGIRLDLFANAFWFLSSWAERRTERTHNSRGLYSESAFTKFGIPQDVVDIYVSVLQCELDKVCQRLNLAEWPKSVWPDNREFAVVLSHDVDFIPAGQADIIKQGIKTVGRHLVKERSPAEAIRAGVGLARALVSGRDPYGCIPEMIAREKALGVQASYQVAVGHRHPLDVNYHIEDRTTCDYLRVITDNNFDLCLHGSFRSTENPEWYAEEVEILSEMLGRPIGSRQHYLSFDYDNLFSIQEESNIRFDMSMGYPDYIGPRAGFSFPYFPWNIEQDRPYDVLQISLFLMDVTLRSYMGLGSTDAWIEIAKSLDELRMKRGGVSVVWHPIVFGNARDPGYGELFWRLVEHVKANGGVATDGRTINEFWRQRAVGYSSFAGIA